MIEVTPWQQAVIEMNMKMTQQNILLAKLCDSMVTKEDLKQHDETVLKTIEQKSNGNSAYLQKLILVLLVALFGAFGLVNAIKLLGG